MTRVLILGANGQLARNTTRVFLEKTMSSSRFICGGHAGSGILTRPG
jgi:hypothetical protein